MRTKWRGTLPSNGRLTRSHTRHLHRTVAELTGLDLNSSRLGLVSAHVARRLRTTAGDFDSYLDELAQRSGSSELRNIVALATNQETSFFRGKRQLEVVDSEMVRLLNQQSSTQIRFWSAACSTGEEALTLGMMIGDRLPYDVRYGVDCPHVEIVGSDLCRTTIESARQGRYSATAESRLGPVRTRRYFRYSGSALVVRSETLPPITFHVHNMVAPNPFGGFDAILIRNVLFYLSPAARGSALKNLARSLKPGGVLVIGANDGVEVPAPFTSLGAHCYRLGSTR